MKKFYLIAFSLLSVYSMAQEAISFENDEGFTMGDINGQGAWISTPTGGIPANVTHQVISADYSTAGSNSLKIVKEPTYGTQSDPIIGGFYNLSNPLSYTNFSVSFDINISQLDGSVFGFQGMDSVGEQFVARVDFDNTGEIKVLNTVSGVQTLVAIPAIWSPNIWYRLKVVGTATEVRYYLNDLLIYTGTTTIPINIDQLRFVHNNASGVAFIDNIKVNGELVLAVKEGKSKNKILQVYPNPASDILNIVATSEIKHVSVTDISGKMINVRLEGNKIDVKSLPTGNYILNVETKEGKSAQRFIKK
ncbi:hypothetical protein C1637_13560 [Chryseobacterium lactis]|uniref:T9SS C-terminal target domain-containing protein n=1 Tax=Chryseobacterium lactis TaxID=1241981 RepID=A0A3G6RGQ6_CHRLC|nr:T9SS type A sorting domain-containing protein [Chryseobacterium lactis]AZA83847.1 T9SS C-terminal target domain-containing protein [Chryseobacterium lactis]AZB04232.1 T9SS C-terminal target domain-containing protein [Chryseobacterium lactis]PNW12860.1 hypothetical protein C1637_13560 [Chryseobacterium lactis]